MEQKEFRIPQLRIGGHTDYIILRVARRWKTILPTTKEFLSIDFLFTDDEYSLRNQRDAAHGYMESNMEQHFSETLKEGLLYKISVFQVKPLKGTPKYNAIPAEKTILIYWSTEVREVTEGINKNNSAEDIRFKDDYSEIKLLEAAQEQRNRDNLFDEAIESSIIQILNLSSSGIVQAENSSLEAIVNTTPA
ncbi:Nucleic acid-binding-like protein [Corchorus capsularis]|uniref:Nucleic acid-binding-like protein n=1 Tax=Corchorus capsularis TaxID=210143 RepID=A0A1R3G4D0_COCAP|nr:Nucleic acid-binding-like protein [Corchorus capsularis]